MKKEKAKLEVGQQVFIVNDQLKIEEKKVRAIVFEEQEVKYQLSEHSCGGTKRTKIFITKQKAEVEKQNFLDKLRFKVGDLLIFKYKSFSRDEIEIGRVVSLKYSDCPYKIITVGKVFYDVTDDYIILSVKNEFIENFGNLKELDEEFEDAKKKLNEVIKRIHNEHEKLERELKHSFKKQYKWSLVKKKPLFKDRFDYLGDDY